MVYKNDWQNWFKKIIHKDILQNGSQNDSHGGNAKKRLKIIHIVIHKYMIHKNASQKYDSQILFTIMIYKIDSQKWFRKRIYKNYS